MGSRNGAYYVAASGAPIRNEGEKVLKMVTPEGQVRQMTFQVANISRALGSVSKMCANGNAVIFDDDGSYILNKATGEVTWLRQENGVYLLDVGVAPSKWRPESGVPEGVVSKLRQRMAGAAELGDDNTLGSQSKPPDDTASFTGPGR